MTNTNATQLRKNLFGMLGNAIKYNETICVNTKDGNVFILSEEEYNGMIATLELSSNASIHDKIIAGKNESLKDCVGLDEIKW
ncbi:MAG: type II toxin-antitoxin system Phd/YefM family antitoxin [Clostridia bacterium]|nr:type II toxin-antitoxin system Phd/YefM family antitoxin [Clostridia bacterium]